MKAEFSSVAESAGIAVDKSTDTFTTCREFWEFRGCKFIDVLLQLLTSD